MWKARSSWRSGSRPARAIASMVSGGSGHGAAPLAGVGAAGTGSGVAAVGAGGGTSASPAAAPGSYVAPEPELGPEPHPTTSSTSARDSRVSSSLGVTTHLLRRRAARFGEQSAELLPECYGETTAGGRLTGPGSTS